jgi:hypothetical protein
LDLEPVAVEEVVEPLEIMDHPVELAKAVAAEPDILGHSQLIHMPVEVVAVEMLLRPEVQVAALVVVPQLTEDRAPSILAEAEAEQDNLPMPMVEAADMV